MVYGILKRKQSLPIGVEEALKFFSSPVNLSKITPREMDFTIIEEKSDPIDLMYAGMIIAYRVRPLLGIPLVWVTEITELFAPEYFIDEQLFGPYAFWQHQHHFRAVDGGTEISDTIRYRLKGGIFSKPIEKLFVARQLTYIFNYRAKVLAEIFPTA